MIKRFNAILESGKLPWIIIGYGIVLRIVQYLHNPSLYIDEARDTVVAILGRTFSELFGPPPAVFIASPPAGFIVIEKIAVYFLGDGELALRLYPLVTGIASLFLFYFVARRYISSYAVTIALILFAILEPLIYYSSSIRPYSGDVAFALLILLAASHLYYQKLNGRRILLYAAVGAIIVWFSSPSVFVLAGVGTCLIMYAIMKKEWSRTGGFALIYTGWAASFALCYFLYLHHLSGPEYSDWVLNNLKGENAYIQFPPLSFSVISSYIEFFFSAFRDMGFFYVPGIAGLAFFLGCIAKYRGKRSDFFFLISPVLFALLASGLALYPFKQRMILFLVPSFLLLMGEGIDFVRKNSAGKTLISLLLTSFLLFHPFLSSAAHLVKPIHQEELKLVLSYLIQNQQEGDIVYVHYRAHPAFTYYAPRYGFNDKDVVVGSYAGDRRNLWAFSLDYLKVYTDDLDRLRGHKRVWVLFIETPPLRKGINEEIFFNYYLSLLGKKIDSYKSTGAAVYLYDLSGEADLSSDGKGPEKKRELHWYF